jgi:hypothetical protein
VLKISKYKYTSLLMQKVVGDYLDFNPLYKEAMLKVWDLTVKVMLRSSISSKLEIRTL